jgi:hypothetical protein
MQICTNIFVQIKKFIILEGMRYERILRLTGGVNVMEANRSERQGDRIWVFLHHICTHCFSIEIVLKMASASSKSVDDQRIDEYMEDLSRCYFGQLFPNSNISIQPKAKKGKQAGHVVVVNFTDSHSTGNIIKVIYR